MRNPYLNLLSCSYHFAKDRKKAFIATLLLFAISNLVALLQPLLFGKMLNSIQKGGSGMMEDLFYYLALFSVVPFFFWIFHGVGRYLERTNSFFISKNYREHIFGIVTDLPFSWHADNHSGETINKINKSSRALSAFSDDNYMYIQTIVTFVGSLGGIAIISWYLSLGMIISTVLVILMIIQFDKKLIMQYEEILKRDHKVASLMQDYLSNIRTVITLHLEEFAKKELVRKIMDMYAPSKKNYIFNEIKWFSMSAFVNVVKFAILTTYAYTEYRSSGTVLVGSLVIVFQFLDKFMDTFFNFAWQYENIVRLNTEYMSARYIFDDHTYMVSKKQGADLEDWKRIEIADLNFRYGKNTKTAVLKDISIKISKGERIAFIGESGGGKSTMLSLLKGLYGTEDIRIMIDGKEFKSSEVLTNITTLIPQDPEIFENTIRYNVTFGLETEDDKILKSIGLSRFDAVLSRLSKGLDTNIKEKGVNLSGGEKQRLALARGLFSAEGRTIIILDEPTSSVDALNELEIYKNIFNEFKGKTVISSIHKLHLLPMFDKIYLFENGEITESGTFDEVLRREGKIKTMWESYQESHNEYQCQ